MNEQKRKRNRWDRMGTLVTIMRHREYVADELERLADELRKRARKHDRS